ncbi:3274_t:CDS:2, partial [Acaulospora colombiana]
GYRPRIPPFNTMMQLYTHVKPNRERAMHYFNLMQRLGLMLDVYGKIEPVDIPRMEEIIQSMKNRRMDVTGNHYSSLITAKGCAMHDLDAASAPLPDVLAYEALLSVVVTHHRIDLMQSYFDTMLSVDRVRPTAYIYNLLIKGYAAGGQIDRARAIFEQMKDPQAGAAAPNNHLPHAYMGNDTRPPAIREMNGRVDGHVEDPVYREPSSWEAMVRAELSVGDRERAGALLERMRARFYPAAVTAKIEGILWEPNGTQKSPTDSA